MGVPNVPIIVWRCVEEVERRGLDIIGEYQVTRNRERTCDKNRTLFCATGLYRLCGSATKKRILREAFERNARSVNLSPDNVPDINVITGKMRHEIRESYPTITRSKQALCCFRRAEGLPTRTSRTSLHEVPLPNDGRRTGRLFAGRPAGQR